jgi:flagellar hook-associated protein 3 FlgL
MRVTQRTLTEGVGYNLQAAVDRLSTLQERLSSGKAVQRPSDAPAAAVAALRYRADIRRSEQLKRNADDAQGWLDSTDRALTGGIGVLNRARELVLQGTNGSMGAADRAAIAEEVDGLRQSLLAIANTAYLGRPVFNGTAPGTQAYDPAGTYLGDTGAVDRVVAPNVSIRANLTGPAAFGPPGADAFAVLTQLADHLRNDPSQLQGDITAVDGALRRMTDAVAGVGARAKQVDDLRLRLEDGIVQSTNGLAEVESVDLPATIIELQLQEVAYQAALGATARVIQPSLLDFLR